MSEILKAIKSELPNGVVSEAIFEGANIVLYTTDKEFFRNSDDKIRDIVKKVKKRIELRADSSMLAPQEETEKTIRELVPTDAEIESIIFDVPRSTAIVEAKRPGIVIGKNGSILKEIKNSTMWTIQTQRSPAIHSKITEKIRDVLYANNSYRKKFLNEIGKKIYENWNPEKMDMWVRLTYLGSGRQVGRSCLLLQTPKSKIVFDCGINVGVISGPERFPYLDVSEIGDISSIDAIVLSHAHLDHCLPPQYPVLTEKGYKKIDDIKVGENVISLDWKSGKYISSKVTEKTQTNGHKRVLTIKTPYSTIESSPNHRFFTVKNLEIKETEAQELTEHMLLPSNLLHKDQKLGELIPLITKVQYNKKEEGKTHLPHELTPNLAEFIGYYMGDGHKSTPYSLRLTDSHIPILEYHKEIIKELFNSEAIIRHHSDKTKNAHILEINNIKIIRFLENNFPEFFSKTRDIRIPEKIINSGNEVQLAFLRGFADAEGTVSNRIKITSFSKEMIKDLQHLFSLNNIPSHISGNDISISSIYGLSRFKEKVGFSIKYKMDNLMSEVSKFNNHEFNKQDLVPLTSNDLREILKVAGMLGKVHDSPNLSNILPMSLLDLFRRKEGYATRKTAETLLYVLKNRITEINKRIDLNDMYVLRQLLSLTRTEISLSTGLKVSQIQQIEENRISKEFAASISHILSSFMKDKMTSTISAINNKISLLENILKLEVIWEKITTIDSKENPYPYLVDIEVESHNFIAGNIVVHNSGLIPYLYKMGYKGPVYMTPPTRDISALLALDLVSVHYKKAEVPIYRADDVKEMVRHSICLNYGEVFDITPDIRITFYNAGHVLGSAITHVNIGNGLHNFVYTGDSNYRKTRLLDPAVNFYPRVESIMVESTYGSKDQIQPPLSEVDEKFCILVNDTIKRGGKILLPELGLGHAQETLLRVEDAIRTGKLPQIPVYLDGMLWDITAIHTAYPEFLGSNIRNKIFNDENPFTSSLFKRVGSPTERKEVFEGGPCIVIATNGMLAGGASVEYFKEFAENEKNLIIFGCYQGPNTLGRQVSEGNKVVRIDENFGGETINVNMQVETMSGLSAHSGRGELMQFIGRMTPKPKKVIISHGEQSRCLDFASSIYRQYGIETIVPRNLETIRLK
ncbi:MAG: MBL fold metallo-hydrolase RNA specificity domain-containing protein [Nanoarchaeota archaeon]